MSKIKVHYFNFAARAEPTRLCLTVGGVPYEDVFYTRESWPEFKPKTPFGQVPVLELPDGTMLGQSGALVRYAAKLAKLYPEDPLAAAHADQAYFLLTDLMELFTKTFYIQDQEEKVKARQELLAPEGKGRNALNQLNKLIEKGGGGFVAGGKLSFADIEIFCALTSFTTGLMDGIPKTLLDEFPALKAYRNKVASVPEIKAHYEKVTDGSRDAFKPSA